MAEECHAGGGINEYMYLFLLTMQYVGIIVLVLEIIFVLRCRSTKLQTILLVVLMATLVNFVGYLFEMQATTQEMALQAVKTIYIGKPFIILFIFIFFMERMGIRKLRFLYPVLSALHIAVSAMVLTCEHHAFYYKSIDYRYESGLFPHLVLGHSAFYLFYHIVILSYFFFMFAAGMRALGRAKDRRERTQIKYLMAIAAISVVGLLAFFSGISGGYDTTIPAYLVSTILLLVLIAKYDLLDTLSLAKENVIDEFAEGLLIVDRNEKVLYANAKLQALLPGLGSGSVERAGEELHGLCAAGRKLVCENSIYQIYEKEIIKDGSLGGKMFVVRDVTEGYNHEIELKKQTEIANRANQAKSDFLARMSHEIRTPINAVMGMNEMILRESGEETIRRYAMDVHNSANILLDLVNDVLDTSKIESGKMKIVSVRYELDSLLNDVVIMVRTKARQKGLKLCVSVAETLPNGLTGDDVRIRQILVNLLNNSVKYTQKGRVSLSLKGFCEEDGVRLHFEISDTGIGMKDEDLPKLFAAFERIDESKNRNIEGSGLGMNIVFELLRLMGTELKISSVYGEGSVFSFDLKQGVWKNEPIGDFAGRSMASYKDYTYKAAFCAPRAKILLVDDNDVNRKVFTSLLKETKVMVDEAASGFACLEKIKEQRYDIIFMDHMMPEMDGIETFRRMRSMEHKCKAVPVIILTANAVAGAREHYLEEGFFDYLSKPINIQKLERLLRKYLPEELIEEAGQEHEPESASAAKEGNQEKILLPDLEEFDWNYARLHFPNEEALKQTLNDIWQSMDSDMERLGGLYGKFAGEAHETAPGQTQDALDNYRILVHAIKSNMAMAGALLLSKLARLLEAAAADGNIGRIVRIHPVFMEEMQAHKQRLATLFEDGGKREANVFEVLAILDFLKQGLMEEDYGMLNELLEQLAGFSCRELPEEKVEQLIRQVKGHRSKEALETVQELMRRLSE